MDVNFLTVCSTVHFWNLKLAKWCVYLNLQVVPNYVSHICLVPPNKCVVSIFFLLFSLSSDSTYIFAPPYSQQFSLSKTRMFQRPVYSLLARILFVLISYRKERKRNLETQNQFSPNKFLPSFSLRKMSVCGCTFGNLCIFRQTTPVYF